MHPLTPDLGKLTDEDLHKNRGDLQTKLMFAYRMGNTDLVGQIQLVLSDYMMEIETRNKKMMDQTSKDGKSFADKINITK
jgi:hypothetical protein